MPRKPTGLDPLFLEAENRASEFSLYPASGGRRASLSGVLSADDVDREVERLRGLSVDDYVRQTVAPSEDQGRPGAREIIQQLGGREVSRIELGPLFAVEMKMDFGPLVGERRVGILAQDRSSAMGAWLPEHHLAAVEVIRDFAHYNMPIVTLIDTPGADAGEQANRQNQAHAISRLIAEFAQIDMPTVGVVIGNGYSGGAIPLATTNILLSLRDGVFNTIQPRGLASIARKYDLSWQECAKYVGVSSYELHKQGYVDGVVDYSPTDSAGIDNLRQAIISSILAVEDLARDFVNSNDEIFNHYARSTYRFLAPPETPDSEHMTLDMAESPTHHPTVFGVAYRYLRYLGLRRRIRSTSIESYGRLANHEIPKGELSTRVEEARHEAFSRWLESPLAIRYDDELTRTWNTYRARRKTATEGAGRLQKLLRGDPQKNLRGAKRVLMLHYGFSLYNLWKDGAQTNFLSLIEYLDANPDARKPDPDAMTILDVLVADDLRPLAIRECENLVTFDLLYDNIIANLRSVAREANETNTISKESVRELLEKSLDQATAEVIRRRPGADSARTHSQLRRQFLVWLANFGQQNKRGEMLRSIEEWKKIAHPRVSEPLFAIITFFFDHLLPQLLETGGKSRPYAGKITPRNIGMKDFWNRLTIAYQDLMIGDVLVADKRARRTTPDLIIKQFFSDFEELNGSLMTADPVNFPGFRISIEEALSKGVKPCGVVTGIGRLRTKSVRRKVGVVISNLSFQAGAFDMASSEKVCKLLVECARKRLPVVCFVSSGGMQTKEGAGSLFSMSIVNDRITRFVRDNDLPILMFGFGDCTGGAQASFVTHPLAHTFYFSGTNMPFAGQIVVPSYLPFTATLSNYLSQVDGAMQGLVQHPFNETIDDELRAIDPAVPVATESVEDVIARVLKGEFVAEPVGDKGELGSTQELKLMENLKRVLLHARGCAAVKVLSVAQRKGIPVVLVQSDPDMHSVLADMIGPKDSLVCIGGNSPDESYLNAQSVIRVAAREDCDALHPGIGFLSENPDFATLCRLHSINFLGPPTESMQLMGNKSNAINTAKRLEIPVVPGSHGIVTHVEAAQQIADDIGYPIVIKAVHGGGGKGIVMVYESKHMRDAFLRICAEARAAFGSSDVYIEKCITSLRHIEVQILRDKWGNTKVLGLRDCSVQRNNQKIVEESDSTMITPELREIAYSSAGRIAADIGYVGAGTVEFIFDLESQSVYFMEMNTRLQVEHPVTERVTGVDIVGAQFDIGAGASIEAMEIGNDGYAIEVRVTAERPSIEPDGSVVFLPDPGDITAFKMPERDHIDIICCVAEGKSVSPYYDSMIAQIICHGEDRKDTVTKLLRYLGQIKIEGICTNIPLLRKILKDKVFRDGIYDTTFLKGFMERIDARELIAEIDEAAGAKNRTVDIDSLRIEGSDELKVIAPSTGVFYLSPSPKDPPFVTEGAVVSTEDSLCLLEAMKVFRALNLDRFNSDDAVLYEPDKKYRIERIIPATGTAVSRGDLLFVVRPV